ncbi:MAG: beta-propeller domain-containing protein, partial [Nocardioidaceae bacterium]
ASTVPRLAAAQLPSFGSCERLRQWYVHQALPLVGPYGFGPRVMPLNALGPAHASQPMAAPDTTMPIKGADSSAVANGPTGTNVQEAGVDEPDVAKTDGTLVVRLDATGRHLTLTDVSAAPDELSRIRLPGRRLADPQLLLDGDTVLVVGNELSAYRAPGPVPMVGPMTGPAPTPGGVRTVPGQTRVHLSAVDISDPSHPVVTAREVVDGALVSARSYPGTGAGSTVRAVVSTGLPPLDFVYPNRDRTPRQATAQNRRIVRRAGIDEWLPQRHVYAASGWSRSRAVACSEVRHPKAPSGFGTLTVLTFPAGDPASAGSTAITTAGDLAYSSTDRIYVGAVDTAGPVGAHGQVTHVFAFALDGPRTRYVAAGTVPGLVKDRWSFDEYDGHLRVATGLGWGQERRGNGVFVLTEHAGQLTVAGKVTGLGRGEQIKSVRWLDALAVVTTYHQTDPVYTLDLSDAAHPRKLGRLRIPGFSDYLHPLGGDLLLGLGQATGGDIPGPAAQAATFDLSHPARPRRTDSLQLGQAQI